MSDKPKATMNEIVSVGQGVVDLMIDVNFFGGTNATEGFEVENASLEFSIKPGNATEGRWKVIVERCD